MIKVMTVAQWDAVNPVQGERFPWIKATDLVHACPASGGHAIILRDGKCPRGCGAVGKDMNCGHWGTPDADECAACAAIEAAQCPICGLDDCGGEPCTSCQRDLDDASL